MNRKYKITLAIVVALSIISVVLIFVGILTHKETTLMTACETETGMYDYTGECFEVKMVGDPPFVVDIQYDNSFYNMSYITILEAEVSAINMRLRRDILVVGDTSDRVCTGDICYIPEQPHDPSWMDTSGDAAHLFSGTKCRIRTSNTGDTHMESLVLAHELGHCLGLAHDDFESSIMRPVQTETPMGELGPWITDDDKDALIIIYNWN